MTNIYGENIQVMKFLEISDTFYLVEEFFAYGINMSKYLELIK